MSHTPGPWWYDNKTSTIRGSIPAYWEDPDDKDADKAPVFNLTGACSGEDIPANVRLACAAPDLLKALRFYANEENWRNLAGCCQSDVEADEGSVARIAIRKAIG